MIQVKSELKTYEGANGNSDAKVLVKSHWNNSKLIVLEIHAADEALQVTVSESDLIAAVQNAVNVSRY